MAVLYESFYRLYVEHIGISYGTRTAILDLLEIISLIIPGSKSVEIIEREMYDHIDIDDLEEGGYDSSGENELKDSLCSLIELSEEWGKN